MWHDIPFYHRRPERRTSFFEQPPLRERWMQQIWIHQRLRRDALHTIDAVPVHVLHPGFWNHRAGPDFLRAIVQLGDNPAQTGDVELDISKAGWQGHRHAGNPDYSKVILRVIWEAAESKAAPDSRPATNRTRPPSAAKHLTVSTDPLHSVVRPGTEIAVMELKPFLEAPITELAPWLDSEASDALPPWVAGRCQSSLNQMNSKVVEVVIRQAAQYRLHNKAHRIAARAQCAGWTQALWESLFSALGYQNNTWPMQRLPEIFRERWGDAGAWPISMEPSVWQARLFGLAGFLPDELPDGSSRNYVRMLWDVWWREREDWLPWIMPVGVWYLRGLRPNNHPQRRLALSSYWLARTDLPQALEQWIAEALTPKDAVIRLTEILEVFEDPFWIRHVTLTGKPLKICQDLLGRPRRTDLVMNAILPWLWARTVAGGRDALRERVETRYFAWPAGESNARIRLACERLFLGQSKSKSFRGAAWQQGLLQIQQSFCYETDSLCTDCELPGLLKTMLPPN